MNTKFAFPGQGKDIAYVKEIDPLLLPVELAEQIDADSLVYAVHNEDGMPLAVTLDRAIAFEMARQNDMSPVSVH